MWDDGSGYSLDDPKNPSFHERYSGFYDNRDKTQPPKEIPKVPPKKVKDD